MTAVRVLLVEDEFLIRTMVAEVLRDEGFEVVEAGDGHQAVTLIDTLDGFDMLLTDVQMPGSIDGIHVAAHIQQRHANIPVIVVSAHPENAQRLARAVPRGIFLRKPYELGVLVKTLQRMVQTDEA